MFDLSAYNTFRLSVFCREGIEIRSVEDLRRLEIASDPPPLILGRGSDVLFTEDFSGTVLINRIRGITVTSCLADGSKRALEIRPGATKSEIRAAKDALRPKDLEVLHYEVSAGGGEILDELIDVLIRLDVPGLENLSLIPGTVGAAPIQNVGAYGMEIGDVITSVETFSLKASVEETFDHERCDFGYRSSYFKKHKGETLFITRVNMRLDAAFRARQAYAGLQSFDFADAAAVRSRIISMRSEKLPDPAVVGNAGSFFKNPCVSAAEYERLSDAWPDMPAWRQPDGSYKLAAGWLIEKAGCKGIRHGQAGTWGRQALVIVNLGKALPHEIVAMAQYVCAEVKRCFAVELIPEVRIYDRLGEVEWNRI